MSRFAPAKINLYLHVTGRRDDGYHTLDSLVAFASIGDEVRWDPSPTFSFRLAGPLAGTLEVSTPSANNLVVRAAQALAEAVGEPLTGTLTLTKNLPTASGLGGGSSDAAATLRLMAEVMGINDKPLLARLAEGLGKDVPCCLEDAPCCMGGAGEVITSAPPLPEVFVVLANPGVPVSTPAVYQARQGAFSPPAPILTSPRDATALAVLLHDRRNDLAAPACRIEPLVNSVLQALEGTDKCLLARVSGSGGTCFGLYATCPEAEAAACRLSAFHPTWWIRSGRLR